MSAPDNPDSRLVYSTECGDISHDCRTTGKNHAFPKFTKNTIIKNDGIVRVSRETKGRKGKGVTLVTGIPLNHTGLAELAKELKRKLGAGGVIKNGTIELQGDHRNVLLAELTRRGFTVKRSGG
jgi:translation initiation factor 1